MLTQPFFRRFNQSEGREEQAPRSAARANDANVVTIGAGVAKTMEQSKLASSQRNRILTFRSTERYLNQNRSGSNESFGRINKKNVIKNGGGSQDEGANLTAWCCMTSKSRNNSQESLAANRSVATAGAA